MRIEFTDTQRALQKELRAYFDELMTPELVAELTAPDAGEGGGLEFRKALRKLGADGWIRLGWPEELGGQGATPFPLIGRQGRAA